MTSIKLCLNKYRAKKNGEFPLVFQIIHKRKRRIISTHIYLLETDFDKENGCIILNPRTQMDIKKNNACIKKIKTKLNKIITQFKSDNYEYKVADITDCFFGKKSKAHLLPYMNKVVKELADQKRYGTLNAYKSTTNRVARYISNNQDFCFNDITPQWLTDFVHHLYHDNLCKNTVNFYLRVFRAIYNRAANENTQGAYKESPFQKVRVKTTKTNKRALELIEFQKLTKLDVSFDPNLELAQDLFMFSYYCRGMSFVDMAFLKKTDIRNNTIYYKRKKNDEPLQIKIIPQLKALINKYKNKGEYLLPIIKENNQPPYNQYRAGLQQLNKSLKLISGILNLPQLLTSYVARHTWATTAKRSGIPISVISESMGHHSERTTNIYLASLDTNVIDKANEYLANLCE